MVCGNFPWLRVSKIKTAICRTVDMPAAKVRSEVLPLRLLVKTRQMQVAVLERRSFPKSGSGPAGSVVTKQTADPLVILFV